MLLEGFYLFLKIFFIVSCKNMSYSLFSNRVDDREIMNFFFGIFIYCSNFGFLKIKIKLVFYKKIFL